MDQYMYLIFDLVMVSKEDDLEARHDSVSIIKIRKPKPSVTAVLILQTYA
jgi:hypothetical protein